MNLFEFNRFPPVTGQTGPVNRNRSPAVTEHRSDIKTLVVEGFIGCIDGTGDGQSLAEVDYYLAYVELTIMVDVV